MPNSCTERKCGHVNTTHDIATAVSSALYRMRRVSQYRRESATERLNSSILKEYEFLQMCVKYFVLQRTTRLLPDEWQPRICQCTRLCGSCVLGTHQQNASLERLIGRHE